MTDGGLPYPHLSNKQVVDEIQNGERLPNPKGCSQELYLLMMDCWAKESDFRPDFETILSRIEKMGPEQTKSKYESILVAAVNPSELESVYA